jgi:hypothetical protein
MKPPKITSFETQLFCFIISHDFRRIKMLVWWLHIVPSLAKWPRLLLKLNAVVFWFLGVKKEPA